MGTSSLYKGPKASVLLPSDYEDNSLEQDGTPQNEFKQEGDTTDVLLDQEDSSNGADVLVPTVTWGGAKSTMTKSYSGGAEQIRNAVKQYTKALGGHKNAARQATSAKRVTSHVIRLFYGSVADIKSRIEERGIKFEGRTTSDIFLDIRDLLAPTPDTLENSYVNKAVNDTIAEIMSDENFNITTIDEVLNTDVLERMVCGIIKYYIYEKLMGQNTLGVIRSETDPSKIIKFEKTLRDCIDGLVSGFVPSVLKEGLVKKEINTLVDDLYEISYQAMEGMKL
jgi:hypothetical protein